LLIKLNTNKTSFLDLRVIDLLPIVAKKRQSMKFEDQNNGKNIYINYLSIIFINILNLFI